jgi:hypothetical protein
VVEARKETNQEEATNNNNHLDSIVEAVYALLVVDDGVGSGASGVYC